MSRVRWGLGWKLVLHVKRLIEIPYSLLFCGRFPQGRKRTEPTGWGPPTQLADESASALAPSPTQLEAAEKQRRRLAASAVLKRSWLITIFSNFPCFFFEIWETDFFVDWIVMYYVTRNWPHKPSRITRIGVDYIFFKKKKRKEWIARIYFFIYSLLPKEEEGRNIYIFF